MQDKDNKHILLSRSKRNRRMLVLTRDFSSSFDPVGPVEPVTTPAVTHNSRGLRTYNKLKRKGKENNPRKETSNQPNNSLWYTIDELDKWLTVR